MKTQEEIEQLAEKHYTQITLSQRTAFKLGYTQCQEDIGDKKYTEEDLKKAFKFYAYAHISQQPHSYEKLEQDYLQFINSLNKQD